MSIDSSFFTHDGAVSPLRADSNTGVWFDKKAVHKINAFGLLGVMFNAVSVIAFTIAVALSDSIIYSNVFIFIIFALFSIVMAMCCTSLSVSGMSGAEIPLQMAVLP